MATAARLSIAADRAGACVRTIFFDGVDLTGVALALEMRVEPEAPGPASIALGMVTDAAAEGLRLVEVKVVNGRPISRVTLRVAEATMRDKAKLPYSGEVGQPSTLFFDLVGIFGGDKRRLCYGTFSAIATVYGMDSAPAARPSGGPGSIMAPDTWSSATLTFTDDQVVVRIDGVDLAVVAASRATDAATTAGARLDDFQTTLAGAVGYAPSARRYVGITRELVNAGADGGDAAAWALPVQPVAMLYDRFHVSMSASGTGRLALWTRAGELMRRAQVFPVVVAAGYQSLAVKMQVPAGGTVTYERVTGGNVLVDGFNASPLANLSLPPGGALGDLAAPTPRSHDYAFGASGFAIEEAPAQLRLAAEARNNRPEVSLPKRYSIGVFGPDSASFVTDWKARGVTAVIQGAPVDLFRQGSGEEVKAAILASGLDFIVRPGRWTQDFSDAALMLELSDYSINPRCIGIGLPDEPDLNGHPLQPGSPNPHPALGKPGVFDPAATRAYYEREIQNYRYLAASKPIFCNIQGIFQQLGIAVWPERYHLAGVDIWGTDDYPNVPNAGAGFLVRPEAGPQRFSTTRIGLATRQTVQQGRFNFGGRAMPTNTVGKPCLFHLATGRTQAGIGQYPDPAQWMCIAFSGIISGATGHVYFPQRVPRNPGEGDYISDDSSPAILAAMQTLHKRIAKLESLGALVDPLTGLRTPYRVLPCAWAPYDPNTQTPAFITARDEQLPGPFEGSAHYLANGDTLYLINNTRPVAATLNDLNRGIVGLTFAAWGQRAVLASDPTVDLFQGL